MEKCVIASMNSFDSRITFHINILSDHRLISLISFLIPRTRSEWQHRSWFSYNRYDKIFFDLKLYYDAENDQRELVNRWNHLCRVHNKITGNSSKSEDHFWSQKWHGHRQTDKISTTSHGAMIKWSSGIERYGVFLSG